MEQTELPDIVPKTLIDVLASLIRRGIREAEEKFSLNKSDEDSITGALGHAISTARPVHLHASNTDYVFEITSWKIRGKGPDAPEKDLGADAIFQIRLSKEGDLVFVKGLPFQAKVGGGLQNKDVLKQAKD